ncbi:PHOSPHOGLYCERATE MUTASE [Salix koriyanagi]|uniref:phosphoglycerate mutase (2,3-diphosphoglycerate-dependent) n=1 Tax=Salix koriyanagi TaxID=2511006 RepID=A0A9Q0SLX1_9ROSI|nr:PHOSPHOGLYCERATE MUTASE [Salix koriyanagi]
MAAGALHRSIRTIQLHGCSNDSAYTMEYGNSSLKLISKGFTVDVKFLSNRSRSFNHCKMHVFHAISSHASVIDPTLFTSHVTTNFNQNTSIESSLILIRHGESMWNERNLFTGSVDVPLTKRGIEEAIEAGKRISSIPVNMIYTSALIRAQMTAMLAMTQHRQKKGLNKEETVVRYGKEKVHEWRRSFDSPPPNGESLEMCSQRAVAFFKENIEPQLQNGRNIVVAAHGNSLRSIIMYLEKLTSQEVTNLELSTGVPLLYIYKHGGFLKRGSPVGPTEYGVYAYTRIFPCLSFSITIKGKYD